MTLVTQAMPQNSNMLGQRPVANTTESRMDLLIKKYGAYEANQLKSLLIDVRRAVKPALENAEIDTIAYDLTRYLYSDIEPAGQMSGAQITHRIMYGEDSLYNTPKHEAQFIEENADALAESITPIAANRPVEAVSLGCGPHVSVYTKDYAVTRGLLNAGVNIKRYTAVDINTGFAERAGKILVEEGGLTGLAIRPIAQDFSKPITLNCNEDTVPLMYFFGNTIAQFRSTSDGRGKPPLEKLFLNLGKSTNFSGLLFIMHAHSRNCDKLVEKYRGSLMESWAKSVWSLLKIASGDPNFEPCALEYHPTCENGVVDLGFFAKKKTSITLPGCSTFNIPKGFEATIGWSEQHSPAAIIKAAEKSGWRPLTTHFHNVNGTHGMLLAGKNLA